MNKILLNYFNIFKHYLFILLLLSMITFSSCRDNEVVIPYAQVNFSIDLNDPEFYDLRVIGNAVTVTGGVNGIVVFRKNIDSDEDFVAYDRTCTNDPNFKCKLSVDDDNNAFAYCECCDSKFNFYGGYFEEGPAEYPLTSYTVSYNPNTEILTVTNF